MKISIEIPEACGENWEHMTVSQLGKFCQVCKKEVIDFTNTTDDELLQKIKSGQKICGRFKQSQLSRDLKPNNSKTNWKQLAVAAGFTSVLAIAAPANAQKTSTKTEQLEKTSEKNSAMGTTFFINTKMKENYMRILALFVLICKFAQHY